MVREVIFCFENKTKRPSLLFLRLPLRVTGFFYSVGDTGGRTAG